MKGGLHPSQTEGTPALRRAALRGQRVGAQLGRQLPLACGVIRLQQRAPAACGAEKV